MNMGMRGIRHTRTVRAMSSTAGSGNSTARTRLLAAVASLLALASNASCDSSQARVVTEKEHGSTIVLAIGETVRFELASEKGYYWLRIDGAFLSGGSTSVDPLILETKQPEYQELENEKTLSIHEFTATGGGEVTLRFWNKPRFDAPQTTFASIEFTVTVEGDPRTDDVLAGYKGFKPVGGFGQSRESGKHIRDLALFPDDLVAGVDGKLYVTSENRVWRIDPATHTGEIVIDSTRSSGPLPPDAVVTAIDQRGSADWLLGIRRGTTNEVGWLRSNGTWEPLRSWTSTLRIHRVRIAPDGESWAAVNRADALDTSGVVTSAGMATQGCSTQDCGGKHRPDALEFDGDLLRLSGLVYDSRSYTLAGRDQENRILLLSTPYAGVSTAGGALYRLDDDDVPVLLFEIVGRVEVPRETDFLRFLPAGSVGSGSSKHEWPGQKAAVTQLADGSLWGSSVELVQPDDFKYFTRGRGLFLNED